MHSSTSPFSAKVPWFALWLIALAFVSLTVARFYTVRFNPEVLFWRDSARVKQAWARQCPAEKGARMIFAGGSSCFTSINTSRLVQHNVRALNMGLGAGLGVRFLTQFALSEVKPGDTLVVAIEPPLLIAPMNHPALAVQLSEAMNAPELLQSPDAPEPSAVRAALAMRPGAYHAFTLLGKALRGRPLFRYNMSQVSQSGWQRLDLHWEFAPVVPYRAELSQDVHKLLAWLRDWSAANHVRLVYSMPWCYVSETEANTFREHSRNLLLQIAAYMPVLKDPLLGAYCVRKHYGDTALHLDAEGAALRTDSIAQQLTNWSVWSSAELAELRFSKDGAVNERTSLASRVEDAKKEN
jgi:hypothetical protein